MSLHDKIKWLGYIVVGVGVITVDVVVFAAISMMAVWFITAVFMGLVGAFLLLEWENFLANQFDYSEVDSE